MFRLAVAVIEGEESRIRESLEGEEGEGKGEVQDPEWEKRRRELGDKRTEAAVTGLGTSEQMDSQDLWQSG